MKIVYHKLMIGPKRRDDNRTITLSLVEESPDECLCDYFLSYYSAKNTRPSYNVSYQTGLPSNASYNYPLSVPVDNYLSYLLPPKPPDYSESVNHPQTSPTETPLQPANLSMHVTQGSNLSNTSNTGLINSKNNLPASILVLESPPTYADISTSQNQSSSSTSQKPTSTQNVASSS
uniref:PIAS2 n=1 Tax=Heterorhabditis bacteriophora TaxID=37862 RepID=A0A1I7XNW3_HETBA